MRATSTTAYISFLALAIANAAAGGLVSVLCNVYRSGRAEPYEGHQLPTLTAEVLWYADTMRPVLLGSVVGLLIGGALILAHRSEILRPHVILLISVGWTLVLIQVGTTAIALALPFVNGLEIIPPA